MFNGEGILKRNGRMYEGIFEDGKFVKGQYVDHANRTFIGHFTSNNKLNGTGLIQFQDGFVVNGTFINNKLQVEKYDDVVPAIGKFDGRKHGLLETKLGWYIGKWKDKKPHDKNGRIYGDRGGRFSGEIQNYLNLISDYIMVFFMIDNFTEKVVLSISTTGHIKQVFGTWVC